MTNEGANFSASLRIPENSGIVVRGSIGKAVQASQDLRAVRGKRQGSNGLRFGDGEGS